MSVLVELLFKFNISFTVAAADIIVAEVDVVVAVVVVGAAGGGAVSDGTLVATTDVLGVYFTVNF